MKKKIIKLGFIASLIFGSLLEATWISPPVDISILGEASILPSVAVDPNGNATAVWQATIGSDTVIQASTKPFGGDWQAIPDTISVLNDSETDPDVTVDPMGNVTAAWVGSQGVKASTKPFGGNWQPVADSLTPGGIYSSVEIISDAAGNVTAIWFTGNIIQASSKPFGGVWQAVPDNLTSTGQSSDPQIGVDLNGNVTAVWQESVGPNIIIQASTKPFNGTWQVNPDNLSSASEVSSNPQIAVDLNGNATAIWNNASTDFIQTSYKPFNGNWQVTPENISPASQTPDVPQIAVDPSGNLTAVWQTAFNTSSVIEASTKPFGGDWQATPNTISVSQTSSAPQISVDIHGNATAVWQDFSDNSIQASAKPFGGQWQANPIDISLAGQNSQNPVIAVDAQGNATAVWVDFTTGTIQSTQNLILPTISNLTPNQGVAAGGTQVTITGTNFMYVNSVDFGGVPALSFTINSDTSITAIAPPGSSAVNVTASGTGGSSIPNIASIFTYPSAPITPPSSFFGRELKNRFLTQTDIIYSLAWTPSSSAGVIGYNLYRNGILIAQIPASGPLLYEDHNRRKHESDVYALAAYNAAGNQSPFLFVTFPQKIDHFYTSKSL